MNKTVVFCDFNHLIVDSSCFVENLPYNVHKSGVCTEFINFVNAG